MTKIEYFILTSLFELPSPVGLFFRSDTEEIFNQGKVGFDQSAIIMSMNSLLKGGYVENIDNRKKTPTIFSGKEGFHLGLTTEGGVVAGEYLKVDWIDYIKSDLMYISEKKCKWVVETKRKKNLNNIIQYLRNKGIAFELLKLSPWLPVYWKKLESGYQISIYCPCVIYDEYYK